MSSSYLSYTVIEELERRENIWTDRRRHAEGLDESGHFSEGVVNIAYHQAEQAEQEYWAFIDVHNIAFDGNTGKPYRRED